MNFSISNIGQISKADIEFGDLTILLGAQATGKSVYLQLFKLWNDQKYIKMMMNSYGEDWNKKQIRDFIGAYLGEGMQEAWDSKNSQVSVDYKKESFSPRVPTDVVMPASESTETVYYVPAQRALTMPDGWPSPFRSYSYKTPFVVKNFSEHIRLYLEKLKEIDTLFPINKKLKMPIKDILNNAIFHNATISKDTAYGKKEVKLKITPNIEQGISYIAWSTGQREFLPLLLGCYELLPAGKVKKIDQYNWVIIEEPEMGQHPKATLAIMALIIDLISRGYKVIISTHSVNVLDIVWGINTIKDLNITANYKIKYICELFSIQNKSLPKNPGIKSMIADILNKSMKTYYFKYDDENKVSAQNISSLDPGEDDYNVSGWGGLSSYSGEIADVVAKAVSNEECGKEDIEKDDSEFIEESVEENDEEK